MHEKRRRGDRLMAENASTTGGEGGATTTPVAPVNPTATTTPGTDPVKPASSSQAFDPTTLSDEDFTKVFGDPRTFTHPRFKALSEKAAEADRLKADNEKAENARLEKNKEYQELATKHEQSANDWKAKFESSTINNAITAEAVKLGITDIDAATKLIDRSGISIGTDGAVNGVVEAVKSLAESKAYLVDKSKQVPTIGSPSNPGNNNASQGSTRQFKASELRDPAFFKEHAKEIDAALKIPGAIINDL